MPVGLCSLIIQSTESGRTVCIPAVSFHCAFVLSGAACILRILFDCCLIIIGAVCILTYLFDCFLALTVAASILTFSFCFVLLFIRAETIFAGLFGSLFIAGTAGILTGIHRCFLTFTRATFFLEGIFSMASADHIASRAAFILRSVFDWCTSHCSVVTLVRAAICIASPFESIVLVYRRHGQVGRSLGSMAHNVNTGENIERSGGDSRTRIQ